MHLSIWIHWREMNSFWVCSTCLKYDSLTMLFIASNTCSDSLDLFSLHSEDHLPPGFCRSDFPSLQLDQHRWRWFSQSPAQLAWSLITAAVDVPHWGESMMACLSPLLQSSCCLRTIEGVITRTACFYYSQHAEVDKLIFFSNSHPSK